MPVLQFLKKCVLVFLLVLSESVHAVGGCMCTMKGCSNGVYVSFYPDKISLETLEHYALNWQIAEHPPQIEPAYKPYAIMENDNLVGIRFHIDYAGAIKTKPNAIEIEVVLDDVIVVSDKKIYSLDWRSGMCNKCRSNNSGEECPDQMWHLAELEVKQ